MKLKYHILGEENVSATSCLTEGFSLLSALWKFNYKEKLRGEWVSCLIFLAYLKSIKAKKDADWLRALQDKNFDQEKVLSYFIGLNSLSTLFDGLDSKKFPAAFFVLWAMLDSHKIPASYYNFNGRTLESLKTLFEVDTIGRITFTKEDFPKELFQNENWRLRVSNIAYTLSVLTEEGKIIKDIVKNNAYFGILIRARLVLKLAEEKDPTTEEYFECVHNIVHKLELFTDMPNCRSGKKYYPNENRQDVEGVIFFKYNDCRKVLAHRYEAERSTILINEILTPQRAEFYKKKFHLENEETSVMIDSKTESVITSFAWRPVDLSPIADKHELDFLVPPNLIVSRQYMFRAYSAGNESIIPLLRMMGSNLVFENLTQYTGEEFVAIKALVYLCGVFGRKCSFSSILLTAEEIVQLVRAYDEGWQVFAYLEDADPRVKFWTGHKEDVWDLSLDNKTLIAKVERGYCRKNRESLEEAKAFIYTGKPDYESIARSVVLNSFIKSHPDALTNDLFGVVRFNNSLNCIEFNDYLATHDLEYNVKTLVYCECEAPWVKNAKEEYLNNLFHNNHLYEERIEDPVIKKHLEKSTNTAFVVITDCDLECAFDWAILEPNQSTDKMIANMMERYLWDAYEQKLNDEEVECTPGIFLLFESFDGKKLEDYKPKLDFKNLDTIITLVHNSLGIFEKENERNETLRRLGPTNIENELNAWILINEEQALEDFSKNLGIKKEEVKKIFE